MTDDRVVEARRRAVRDVLLRLAPDLSDVTIAEITAELLRPVTDGGLVLPDTAEGRRTGMPIDGHTFAQDLEHLVRAAEGSVAHGWQAADAAARMRRRIDQSTEGAQA